VLPYCLLVVLYYAILHPQTYVLLCRDVAVFKLKDLVMKVRLWMSNPNWHSASHTLRKIAAGIMFLIAMVVVIVTFAPLVPGNVELRNHGKSAQ